MTQIVSDICRQVSNNQTQLKPLIRELSSTYNIKKWPIYRDGEWRMTIERDGFDMQVSGDTFDSVLGLLGRQASIYGVAA